MSSFKDKTGQKFEKWTVIEQSENIGRRVAWLCKCECGVQKIVISSSLSNTVGRRDRSISCGCSKQEAAARQVIDIKGNKYNKLTVVERKGKGKDPKKRHMYWECICECGNKVIVDGVNLRNGTTKSCGCLKDEARFENAKKLLSPNPQMFTAKQIWKKKSSNYSNGDLTFDNWVELTQLPCHYCGRCSQESNVYNAYKRKHVKKSTLPNILDGEFRYNGLDRIDNAKPHNLDNVVPCCKICNQAKMAASYREFLAWIKQAHNHISHNNDLLLNDDGSCVIAQIDKSIG